MVKFYLSLEYFNRIIITARQRNVVFLLFVAIKTCKFFKSSTEFSLLSKDESA